MYSCVSAGSEGWGRGRGTTWSCGLILRDVATCQNSGEARLEPEKELRWPGLSLVQPSDLLRCLPLADPGGGGLRWLDQDGGWGEEPMWRGPSRVSSTADEYVLSKLGYIFIWFRILFVLD